MPQGRIILKRICQSRKMAELKTHGARLLYTWLIPNLDVNGCFSADPKVIKGQIFTRLRDSQKVISQYLEDLQNVGSIILYESDGDFYLHVPDFADKQPSINPEREAKSAIPPPTPEQLQSNSRVTPLKVNISKVKVKESKYSDFFENFWKAFKGRWRPESDTYRKGSKSDAWEIWQQLTDADKERAMAGAKNPKCYDGEFTPDCCRWLKQKRWET